MTTPTIKPGYQTTEFWQTLLTNLIAALALFGVQVATSDDVIHAIAVIAALLTSALVTHSYTQGRSRVKIAQLAAPLADPPVAVSTPPTLRVLPPSRPDSPQVPARNSRCGWRLPLQKCIYRLASM